MKEKLTFAEAEEEMNSFSRKFLSNAYSEGENTKVRDADAEFKGEAFYKELKFAGRSGQGIQLWLEKWNDGWYFSLATSFSKKKFEDYFPNYENNDKFYREDCWDCNSNDVKMPNVDELTFQCSDSEFYLSLYINEGHECESVIKFYSDADIKKVCHLSDDNVTKKLQQTWARVGQGKYRSDMMKMWNNACSVTGCNIEEALIASHAKPWRDCNDDEKVNPHNGLLLSANLDALFDKFIITFDEEGKILIRKGYKEECKKLNITENLRIQFKRLDDADKKQVQDFLKENRKYFEKANQNK